MKILLCPGNNSYSHILKCIVFAERLRTLGHQAAITITQGNLEFVRALDPQLECILISDLNESDCSFMPTTHWFAKPDYIYFCYQEMLRSIDQFKPDKILGVFSFIAKVAACKCGIPFVGMTCGCMTSQFDEPMGFYPGERDAPFQDKIIKTFFAYAGDRIVAALEPENIGEWSEIRDARELLEGDTTLLWDFPDFQPLQPKEHRVHVGPIRWTQQPNYPEITYPDDHTSVAIISLGTRWMDNGVLKKIVRILVGLGYFVIHTGLKQREQVCFSEYHGQYAAYEFAPLTGLLKRANLLITHGGQMSLFEAIHESVPVFIIPFQPEQAQNGICMERNHCGHRLIGSTLFQQQNSNVFSKALNVLSDDSLKEVFLSFRYDDSITSGLNRMRRIIGKYNGIDSTIRILTDD